jgi:anaerobic selenocysteine-containing dehydrogenase
VRAHGVQPDAHSEPAIVDGLSKTTLKPNPNIDWDAWIADYSRVRDAIERTYPDQFKEMARPISPCQSRHFLRRRRARHLYELMTMRADGQFNTTIYTEDDRFCGVQGSRYVVLMNPADMDAEGLKQGDTVTLSTEANDGVERTLSDLQVVAYDIPRGSIAGYIRSAMSLFRSGTMPRAARFRQQNPFRCASPRMSCRSRGR